jgi:anti-sigma regulatory factor (Ser/Thr protein kinase)
VNAFDIDPVSAITRDDPRLVRAARSWVAQWLDGHGVDGERRGDILLLTTELITNAVRNTFGVVRVTLDDRDGGVSVNVFAESMRLPSSLLDASHERGPGIVGALADDWDYELAVLDGRPGTVVWARWTAG